MVLYVFHTPRDSYSQELAETGSEDSESKPTKLVSVVTQVEQVLKKPDTNIYLLFY